MGETGEERAIPRSVRGFSLSRPHQYNRRRIDGMLPGGETRIDHARLAARGESRTTEPQWSLAEDVPSLARMRHAMAALGVRRVEELLGPENSGMQAIVASEESLPRPGGSSALLETPNPGHQCHLKRTS